jgi:hypothetical protein
LHGGARAGSRVSAEVRSSTVMATSALPLPARDREQGEILGGLVSSESREGAGGTAGSMATSTHAVDNLRKDLELPSGGFSSTEHRRAPEEARGVGRKQMREREVASRGVPGFINRGGELGLWWVASDAIGWRWRCFWTVSCAESRHMGGGVGGILVWLGNGRFQSGFGRVQARWGHTWARGSWVTMASASVCRAV